MGLRRWIPLQGVLLRGLSQATQVQLRLEGFRLLLSQVPVISVLELVLATLLHLLLHELPAVAILLD